jgi:hypothetical protein
MTVKTATMTVVAVMTTAKMATVVITDGKGDGRQHIGGNSGV